MALHTQTTSSRQPNSILYAQSNSYYWHGKGALFIKTL